MPIDLSPVRPQARFPVLLAALACCGGALSAADGTIVFRGLTTGIDASWYNNTSGTSYTTWTNDSSTSFARITYDTQHDYGLNHHLVDRTRMSLYVKYWVRQNGGTAHGPKNFKLFGQHQVGQPAFNTTIALAGYGTEMDIYYGDSATDNTDNTVEWRFLGTTWGGTVFTRPVPTVVTKIDAPILTDNNWHEWGHFLKFNDDNTANGEIIILYDGVEVFHLTQVYNRPNGSAPIDNIGIGQWYQPGGTGYAMTRDYRDVRVAYDNWPQSTDIYGNFTGSAPADTTPPVLSAISAGSISTSGATITWTTDEAATTQVAYGLTTSYGSTTTLVSTLGTAHSQALSGLSAGTVYHCQVQSQDAAGNLATSADQTFTTASVAPSITTQPTGTTVTVGNTASFSVVATGTPTLTYQWRKDGVDIMGATGASYTTPATVLADDGAIFTVVVGNGAGTATSANATLTVHAAVVTPPATSGGASGGCGAGGVAGLLIGLGLMLRLRGRRR